jgi:hypothetical protein
MITFAIISSFGLVGAYFLGFRFGQRDGEMFSSEYFARAIKRVTPDAQAQILGALLDIAKETGGKKNV